MPKPELHGELEGDPSTSRDVETWNYTDAEAFLRDLQFRRWRTSGHDLDRWVFRGQPLDAPLLPSACRDAYVEKLKLNEINDENSARVHQSATIARFARIADRQGLQVPGYTHQWTHDPLHQGLVKRAKQVAVFPNEEWRPLFAIAQHHGIPTHLLDWCQTPEVAMYFASVETLGSKKDRDGPIVVWALNRGVLTSTTNVPVYFETPSYSLNPNLRAQRGLFTVHRVGRWSNYTSLDRSLTSGHSGFGENRPAAVCLRLLREQGPRLFEMLIESGLEHSSLFPGYQGAADQMTLEEDLQGVLVDRENELEPPATESP